LAADIIVAATGLDMQLLSGAAFTVDGERVDFSRRFNYKGMMYSGVPNLASVFGYINASWTLKAELIAKHVCNIVNHMDRGGFTEARPAEPGPDMPPQPWFDFDSGYIRRGMVNFPKSGTTEPWVAHQNYLKDRRFFQPWTVTDGVLRFSRGPKAAADAKPREAVAA
ncbi:MAG: FAD-containing monooxygenase EthA, partial [Caulobacteraceae bacterium]